MKRLFLAAVVVAGSAFADRSDPLPVPVGNPDVGDEATPPPRAKPKLKALPIKEDRAKRGEVDGGARARPPRPEKRLELMDEEQLPLQTTPDVQDEEAPKRGPQRGLPPESPQRGPSPKKTTVEPPPKNSAGEITEYKLTDRSSKYIYVVRTGISLPATLEFPEPLADAPLCGDCTVAGSKEKDANALFLVSGKTGSNRFIVRPNAYPDDIGVSPADFITTITFPLKSFTLVVRVEFTSDRKAVTDYVRWTLPQRSEESRYVADTVKSEKSRLDAEYAAKVQTGVRTELLRMHLMPHRCRSGTRYERLVRKGFIVLLVKELCRYGDQLIAVFTIENRDKLPFLMGKAGIGVTTSRDEDFVELPTDGETLSGETTVAFGEKIQVAVRVTSREAPAFTLRVPELREADGRTLYVRDLAF